MATLTKIITQDEEINRLQSNVQQAITSVSNQSTPSGVVSIWAGPATVIVNNVSVSNDQPGWLICDARSLSKNKYPNLFAAIGYTHSSVTTGEYFQIPPSNYLSGKTTIIKT